MIFLVLPRYFIWHYTTALLDIKNIWINFLVFIYNFFSIPNLVSTLFSPWMKIKDGYSPSNLLETLVFNSMMRIFGIFVRLSFIIIGVSLLLATLVLGLVFYLVWFFLPFLLVIVFLWSIKQFTI